MIHETAIIEPSAKIGKNVSIGPLSYIGHNVEIGDDTIIESHVVVKGPSKIGKNNHIFQFASVGEGCQDKKYDGEPTTLSIGDNNVIRECVTIHRGTIQDIGTTIIGNGNLFMAYTHVAHDCVIGDNNIMANNATIAGHVHLGDWCILAGFTGVHQFVHIGSYSFTSISSVIVKDVPPYVMASGQSAEPRGINTEGIKRRGFSKEAIIEIRRAYKVIYRNGLTTEEALTQLKPVSEAFEEVKLLTDFIANSSRGIVR
jgi:UDP-N-acetylglucosamine acyltransferase